MILWSPSVFCGFYHWSKFSIFQFSQLPWILFKLVQWYNFASSRQVKSTWVEVFSSFEYKWQSAGKGTSSFRGSNPRWKCQRGPRNRILKWWLRIFSSDLKIKLSAVWFIFLSIKGLLRAPCLTQSHQILFIGISFWIFLIFPDDIKLSNIF